ncbi:MAG TPA: alkaline phosphatase family protein [Mycobacteriales bacterium]|nr:alkaline phosphatase family protein [Mycobacteriales bacterium]
MRKRLALAAATALLLPLPSTAAPAPPPVKRVFVYVLENASYADVLGNPKAPYLNALAKQYALATNYTATGHESLGNYISMTSGQPPNPATATDCLVYATALCVQDVANVADQLEAAHHTWRGYMDGMPRPCAHPAENAPDGNQGHYATRHNPFVYYRSIVGDQKRCASHVVALDQLWRDQKAGKVPEFAYVVPDLCHDGHDSGASCSAGGGLAEADAFARRTIPRILADRSFRDGGLLVLTFDEGATVDDDAPLSVESGEPDVGGRVFTVLVTPRLAKGSRLTAAYDHYSLLRTIEDVFCLPYLGRAGDPLVTSMLPALHQQRRC